MKQIIKNALFLLLLAGFIGFSSCTKTSGCEYADEGRLFLTGTFHYLQKYSGSNVSLLDVNAFLIRDDFIGDESDTVLITKSSVPWEYRREVEKHVVVSLEPIIKPGPTFGRGFYKLLCIEEVE